MDCGQNPGPTDRFETEGRLEAASDPLLLQIAPA